ncbi:methyl-accepting chemotaxis protein III [Variovorax paradoxus]|uniref:Methyl-accepting chemotaxis protein III n=1 Tax=Variovorax paradoxus TaxID=34073 RepID=A0A0H2LP19_VARPD|nr:methyl-accepting chemotaxis protein III [Variovorax paradoxus]
MDQVTQQNAALVEEAAAAAQSMQEQAASLVGAVSVFRLEPGTQALRPEPAFAAPTALRPLQAVPKVLRPAAGRKNEAAAAPQLAAAGTAGGDWTEF